MGYIKDFILPSLVVAAVSYLLGSLSFSIIFTKLFSKTDIRTLGSGNAGTTNVLRSVGPSAALFTLVFDFAKGVISVLIGRYVFLYAAGLVGAPAIAGDYGAYLAGLLCVIGHIYPLYYKFKGGKGVLTSSAMIAMVDWRVFVIVIAIFIIMLLITRIVSLSSLAAAWSFPVSNFLLAYFVDYHLNVSVEGPVFLTYVFVSTAIAAAMAVLLTVKHKSNIERIKNGTEKKISVHHKEK
ncbi:MAG: glycerol-3-phosphate 1-O-acyltransferase PlsY [Clostridiales bacterium]|jgi:glycerol-3-phosphate acyltransferase PlsY|nr:glycerol-3-phosphate 1-O-acyltransferase PlsY [Clostridiales bacterium]